MLTCSNPRNTNYYLIQYNDNNFRLLKNKYELEKGWEKFEQKKENTHKTAEEEKERISLSRTKRNIRELALCNNFEYFGTLTLNGYFCNRYDLDDCQSLIKKYLKKIKRKNSNLKYIIITEKHKDNAFHFHGLFSGIDLVTNEYGFLNNTLFNEIGYNSFSKIKDYSKTCNYITKYITKDCVKNSHNQIYFRSKGLIFATKSKIEHIKCLDDINNSINWKYDNDFVSIYDLSLDNLSINDKIVLQDIVLNN